MLVTIKDKRCRTSISFDDPFTWFGEGRDADDALNNGHELTSRQFCLQKFSLIVSHLLKVTNLCDFMARRITERNPMIWIRNWKRTDRLDVLMAAALRVSHDQVTGRIT